MTRVANAMAVWTQPTGLPFPQADRLDKLVELTVHLRSNPRRNDLASVSAVLDGVVRRQVAYYTSAAEFLGLVQCYSTERWRVTPFGAAVAEAGDTDRDAMLACALLRASPIFETAALEAVAGDGSISLERADALVSNDRHAGAELNHTTATRRARTVKSWTESLLDALRPVLAAA